MHPRQGTNERTKVPLSLENQWIYWPYFQGHRWPLNSHTTGFSLKHGLWVIQSFNRWSPHFIQLTFPFYKLLSLLKTTGSWGKVTYSLGEVQERVARTSREDLNTFPPILMRELQQVQTPGPLMSHPSCSEWAGWWWLSQVLWYVPVAWLVMAALLRGQHSTSACNVVWSQETKLTVTFSVKHLFIPLVLP